MLDRVLYARYAEFAVVALAAASSAYLGWILAGRLGAIAAPISLTIALGLNRLTPTLAKVGKVRRVRPASRLGTMVADIAQDVGVGFASLDADGSIRRANDSFFDLVRTPRPAGSINLCDLFGSQHHATIRSAEAALMAGEEGLRELRVDSAARLGEPMLITLGYSERFGRLFCLIKDDSLQLRLEAQVRQASKMQAVGQLAGGLAHDFNNILTAIIGHCDLLLLRHVPGALDHHDADQIRQNANRAADLVRQLLAFSRQQTLRARVVQIADVVGEVGHLLRRLIGEGIRLTVVNAADLAPVRVDPGQIEQVLVNLAVNARDAMPTGGTLNIQSFAVPARTVAALGHKMMPVTDYVAIAVTDTGLGIASDVIGNVFDPFFTTKDVGKGTGLGLSMVYGIVKQSGGFIFVDSAEGRGTRFVIYLPAAIGEVIEIPPPAVPPLEGWGQGTILLVEDEAMVRAVAARALTRSGYEVLTAECGEEALAMLAEREDVDLLLSDVVMIGMDGPTLVQRAQAARPGLRALFMSGYAEEQVRARVDAPGTPLLRKPFSVQELSAAVRARLAA